MGKQCTGPCFSVYIILSLLTHMTELGINSYLAYSLWSTDNFRVWFSLIAGLLIIPLVTVQLVSAVFYLQRQGDSIASWRLILLAGMHVLQLGFYWRHVSILNEHFMVMKKKSLSELFTLRFIYTFTSGLPLLLIESYLFLTESPVPSKWILYAAIGTTLFSSAWSIASYRRQYTACGSEDLVLTWPGTLFRLLWRIGELGARLTAMSLFASLYKHWIFLVISFHWITMCLCVCMSVLTGITGKPCYRIIKGIVTAYIYIFCFINFNRKNATFRYAMFYIIMFFENATLCAVWVFMVPDVKSGYRYLLIFITASSFFVCVVAMSIYYKFFHVHSSHVQADNKYGGMCVSEECINCKLSVCAKHNKELQRPFNTGWLSQYESNQSAAAQYYKNLLHHDSFAESSVPGDINSTISTALSNPNFDIRNLESMSDEERRSVISFISSGTYVHRRYLDQRNQFQCDSWSEYSSDSQSINRDRYSSTGSDSDSVSQSWENRAPSLLTENWDAEPDVRPQNGHPRLHHDSCNSLLRKDSNNWYSDDATTDQVLEWSRLPVTKLGSTGSKTDSSNRKTNSVSRNPDHKSKVDNIKPVSQNKKQAKNVNRLTGKRPKITRNSNYVNDDNVYMEMRSPVNKLAAVYENTAFTDDILTQPEKVFKVSRESGISAKAPWYAYSESGDSALPTQTFSSSTGGDVDNESHSSIELMI